MKKRGAGHTSKNISLTIILITIILAIFLSLFISFLTLSFSANNAESLDTGKIILRVIPSIDVQEGVITVEIEDKPTTNTNNEK